MYVTFQSFIKFLASRSPLACLSGSLLLASFSLAVSSAYLFLAFLASLSLTFVASLAPFSRFSRLWRSCLDCTQLSVFTSNTQRKVEQLEAVVQVQARGIVRLEQVVEFQQHYQPEPPVPRPSGRVSTEAPRYVRWLEGKIQRQRGTNTERNGRIQRGMLRDRHVCMCVSVVLRDKLRHSDICVC